MKKLFLFFFLLLGLKGFGQTDTAKSTMKFGGYLDLYYAYDLGNPENHTRPDFIYSYNRHNELNLNLGFLKGSYETKKLRANLAIMGGTYANANLAAEPGVLKNLFEANVGAKLSKTKNLWLDAGIFSSHIGFESAIGKDCWNLTRSILADNSPYFESGVKISYTSNNEKWFISGLVLNGWQRIQRITGNNMPAFGHQLTFKPNTKITLNSSSFVGSDTPDSIRQMRYFHNFYGLFQLSSKVGITIGFDIGMQQKAKGSNLYNCWYSPVLIAKYSPSSKLSFAVRGEYYSDANGVIIVTGTGNGFRTIGYSINLDYALAPNLLWRIEGRGFSSKDSIFNWNDSQRSQNYFISSAIAFSF